MARRQKTSAELEASAAVSWPAVSRLDVDASATEADQGAPATAFEGIIAGIQSDAIVGWAWDSRRPYEPIEVELYIGDILVGRGKADQFDLNLAKAKRGNGMHRFELRLDRLPSGPPPYLIRAVVAGTDIEIPPPTAVSTLDEAELLLAGSEYLGQITGVIDGQIRGWVFNRRNPHENPVLTLRDGNRNVATQTAVEQTSVTIDSGVTATVFSFQFPLPVGVLDGQTHVLSLLVGPDCNRVLGSPILFGATDVASLGRSLISISDRLERLERQMESLKPTWDLAQLEKQLAAKLLDPVDMLLGVHRDSIERELAVLRRRLIEFARQSPGVDPDVILPVETAPAIDEIPLQHPVIFSAVERALPNVKFDLTAETPLARPSGGLRWFHSDETQAIRIGGTGSIDLQGLVTDRSSIVLRGEGGGDLSEFCGMVIGFNGHPMSGRFDIQSTGEWAFVGNVIDSPSPQSEGIHGLSIEYLSDVSRPSGRLALSEISVFAPGRAPEHVFAQAPAATVLILGNECVQGGWHSVEAGRRGGICWMGARSEVSLRIQRTASYLVGIPEIRPLTADILPKLQINLDSEPVTAEIEAFPGDTSAYVLRGNCLAPNVDGELRTLQINFPREFVKSPMELGLNQDMRPLTIAVRCITLSVGPTSIDSRLAPKLNGGL